MRQEHDRFGNGFFKHSTTNKETKPQSNTNAINCGRDTGDECTSNKPRPRQHSDECTNTYTLRSKL